MNKTASKRKLKTSGADKSSGKPVNLKDVPHSLDGAALFADIGPDDLLKLEKRCSWIEYKRNAGIIQKGEENTDVYILVAGAAHVLNYSDKGRVVDYATLGPGDVFGELAAIDGLSRSASVVTTVPSLIAAVSGSDFLNFVTSHPPVSMALYRKLAGIIRMGDEQISDLSLLGAEQRVCLELLRMAEPDPAFFENLIVFPIPTQSHIANGVGVARETVARIFSRLTQENIIERKEKTLYIRDPEKLESIALS